MKVLVTGGAGFIGSHLVDELVRRKYKVTVLDNLSTGSLKNLKSVKNKIKFIKCDLSKSKNLTKLLYGVDYVFHLAGLSEVTASIKNPYKYYEANVIGTLNILNSVRHLKLKKFIYSASASCYGNPEEIPTKEEAKIQILSPYASTKWISETMVLRFSITQRFPAISLRLFNVYGPRSRASGPYNAVISIFAKQKLANKSLTVAGDGLQSRSFIYVSDVVEAMIKAAKSKIFNEIFNVGSQRSIKINEIAKIFKGKKTYISKRTGDPKHSSANIKKITRKLNWKPKVSIKEGINILLKAANKQ